MSLTRFTALCTLLGALLVDTAKAQAPSDENELAPDKENGAQVEGDKAPPVTAEPTAEAKKEAAERFGRGLSFYEDGDYGLALIEFERAYQLVPDYRVLYNIGQVSIQLSRSAQALRALKQYLEEGGQSLGQERVESVNRDLEMLEARTAHLTIKGTEGAEVLIDDESLGTLPLEGPLLVDAGRHRLEVKRDGYRPYGERLTLAGAEDREITVELEKKPKAVPLVAAPRPETSPQPTPAIGVDAPPPPVRRVPWTIIGWSTTGVLASGAIVSGIVGLNATSQLKELRGKPDTSRSELDDQAQTAKSWLTAADILGAAAIAAGGVSLYLTIGGERGSESAHRQQGEGASTDFSVQFTPRAIHLQRSF